MNKEEYTVYFIQSYFFRKPSTKTLCPINAQYSKLNWQLMNTQITLIFPELDFSSTIPGKSSSLNSISTHSLRFRSFGSSFSVDRGFDFATAVSDEYCKYNIALIAQLCLLWGNQFLLKIGSPVKHGGTD